MARFLIVKSEIRFHGYYYNLQTDLCQVCNQILLNFGNIAQKEEVLFVSFATNFKRICNEKGTSPTRVCLDIGLSSSKVNLWNKGSVPKGDVIIKLAKYLDCTVMDFFDDENVPLNPTVPNTEFALDDDEKDIIRLFRMLDRKQKHEFMSAAYRFEETMLKKEE